MSGLPLSGEGTATGRRRGGAATVFLALLLLLGASPLHAQRLPAVEAEHYARCMEDARQKPAAAFDNANAWRICAPRCSIRRARPGSLPVIPPTPSPP
jgi:hypothetical protein